VNFRSTGVVRVLVVEDGDIWRKFVLSAVQQTPEARAVCQIANGVQALSAVKELRPNLVILDIGLPGLNGIEVAGRIPQLCADSRILFVSQERSEDVVDGIVEHGCHWLPSKVRCGLRSAASCEHRGSGKKVHEQDYAFLFADHGLRAFAR
jgi:CheY-like chemotaxis protein